MSGALVNGMPEGDVPHAAITGDLAERVAALLQIRTGLASSSSLLATLGPLLRARLSGLGLSNQAYREWLSGPGGEAELAMLGEQVVIGETSFFRHQAQLDLLRDEAILPLIVAHQRTGMGPVRLWSAGCSTGEEAYTLAMLVAAPSRRGAGACGLHEQAAEVRATLDVLGTDLSEAALALARHPSYGEWSVRQLRPDQRERYFTQVADRYTPREAWARTVRFARHNLATEPPEAVGALGMDAIVCRNVAIYLTRPMIERAIDHFYRALVPGGWLLMGPSDPVVEAHSRFQRVQRGGFVLYRRPQTESSIPAERDRPRIIDVGNLGGRIATPPPNPLGAAWSGATAASPWTLQQARSDDPVASIARRVTVSQSQLGNAEASGVAPASMPAGRDVVAWPAPATAKIGQWPSGPSSIVAVAPEDDLLTARRLADNGRLEAAIALLDRIEAAAPLLAGPYLLRGQIEQARDNPEAAIVALRRALYLAPELLEASLQLGQLYAGQGRWPEARRSWSSALIVAGELPEERAREDLRGVLAMLMRKSEADGRR